MPYTLRKKYIGGVAALISSFHGNATTISGSIDFDINGHDAWVYIYDQATVNLNTGAEVSGLWTYNQSTTNFYSGSRASFVHTHDQAMVNFYQGSIASSLNTYHSSYANIYGGDITRLILHDQSTVNIYKTTTSWLYLSAEADVTLFGNNFSYSNGILNGLWSDGTVFSFWLRYLTPSGQISTNAPASIPANMTLITSVPIPSAAWLLVSGFVALQSISRRKN